MKYIKFSNFFMFTLFMGMLFQIVLAESNTQEKQSEEIVDKQKYYTILGLHEKATLKEIEYAYHKKVDAKHACISSFKEKLNPIKKEDADNTYEDAKSEVKNPVLLKKEFGGQTVTIYGKEEESFHKISFPPVYGSYYKDQYGNMYEKHRRTYVYDKKGCASYYQEIAQARQAFQELSGTQLERVALHHQELNIDDLDQRRIYNYAVLSNSNLEGLLAIIQEERKKNNLEEVDNFVFGENYQDISLLSPEDKIKAEAILAERLEKEKPQRYADYGMNTAIAGAVVTALALFVRGACS